jgi:hypothetical protein
MAFIASPPKKSYYSYSPHIFLSLANGGIVSPLAVTPDLCTAVLDTASVQLNHIIPESATILISAKT